MADVKKPEVKLATAKLFQLVDSDIFCIAISKDELFGKADTVLVSKDQKTWVQHSYDDFMDAASNEKPIRVG